jgi:hypothetical protein
MNSWTGVALARTRPGVTRWHSRVSTYLHPLAGRPLCMAHRLHPRGAIARPPNGSSWSAGTSCTPISSRRSVRCSRCSIDGDASSGPAEIGPSASLLVDARPRRCGPLLTLLALAGRACVAGRATAPAARRAAFPPPTRPRAARPPRAASRSARAAEFRWLDPAPEALVVRDRAALARAPVPCARPHRAADDGRRCHFSAPGFRPGRRGRPHRARHGALPGRRVRGPDEIGDETVIGPGCRIIDSWIGSGVELKGWNFVVHSSVRNRAILEPYVRRGFD